MLVSRLWPCKLQHFDNILTSIKCSWDSSVWFFRKKSNRKLTLHALRKECLHSSHFRQTPTPTWCQVGHFLHVIISHGALGRLSLPTNWKNTKAVNSWIMWILWPPLSSFHSDLKMEHWIQNSNKTMWFIEKRRLLPFLNHYEKYVIHMEDIFKGGGWDKERERGPDLSWVHRNATQSQQGTCPSNVHVFPEWVTVQGRPSFHFPSKTGDQFFLLVCP